jgi:hypothetical protein
VGHVAHDVDEGKFIRGFGGETRIQRTVRQCRREGRGATFPKGATSPGPDCAANVFVLLSVITICPLVNSNPFRPSPSHCRDPQPVHHYWESPTRSRRPKGATLPAPSLSIANISKQSKYNHQFLSPFACGPITLYPERFIRSASCTPAKGEKFNFLRFSRKSRDVRMVSYFLGLK